MIGERLAEIRKDHNDTQADLARKLTVSLSTVRSWEQEKSAPSHDMLVAICRLYQISSDYLLGLSNLDLSYLQQERPSALSSDEMNSLREYKDFLLWKRQSKV